MLTYASKLISLSLCWICFLSRLDTSRLSMKGCTYFVFSLGMDILLKDVTLKWNLEQEKKVVANLVIMEGIIQRSKIENKGQNKSRGLLFKSQNMVDKISKIILKLI